MVYKRHVTLQVGGYEIIVTSVHLQYQTVGRRAITNKEGPELG
jgi:hypothetical protein